MTEYQNALVIDNLDLVNWVIRTRISIPNRPLLTYDDFYAIGCEAICRAAVRYKPDAGEFAPFACRYIYNAIIDHPLEKYGDIPIPTDEPFDADMWEKIEEILTYKQYEVILLRNQGYTNDEIANLCGVKRKAIEKRFSRIRKILSKIKEL